MPTDAKRQEVTELAEMLRGSSALAVADYRGLTVAEMHTVRRSLRANGVNLKVAKNRLLKIAADQAGLDELKPLLDGPSAIATTAGDEVGLARALQDAFRPYKVVTLRGGLLAGQPVSAADLGRLATLPSREVLLSRLAGGMAAPLSGMAAVLAANLRNLVGVLSAVADQKRATEGDTAPAPTEAAAEPAAEVADTEQTGTSDETGTAEVADAAAVTEATEAVVTEVEAAPDAGDDTQAEPEAAATADSAAAGDTAEAAGTADVADATDEGNPTEDATPTTD